MRRFSSFFLTIVAVFILTDELAQALETQIVSVNAYKVPYLGFDGVFNLNAKDEQSSKNPRNPKKWRRM